jgi:hypothetical protein
MSLHGQRLIDKGVLVRCDIQLEHGVDMSLFTASVHRDIVGRFSQVWRGSNCVSVVAQPNRIDAFMRWIIDQDPKKP